MTNKEPKMENLTEQNEVKSEEVNNETQKPQKTQNVNFEALLKQQAELFEAQQKKAMEEMQEKINTLAANNLALTEELLNLKTNTAEENALLGEKIAQIGGKPELPEYNPYDPKLLYEVYNKEAAATTIMGGDEVECIVGLHEEITANLKLGATEFAKHPYTVKLLKK